MAAIALLMGLFSYIEKKNHEEEIKVIRRVYKNQKKKIASESFNRGRRLETGLFKGRIVGGCFGYTLYKD